MKLKSWLMRSSANCANSKMSAFTRPRRSASCQLDGDTFEPQSGKWRRFPAGLLGNARVPQCQRFICPFSIFGKSAFAITECISNAQTSIDRCVTDRSTVFGLTSSLCAPRLHTIAYLGTWYRAKQAPRPEGMSS